jgi:hypothetical protein
MSSGPVGLDVHEYSYGVHYQVMLTGAPDIYRVETQNRWLVTRIRFWATAGTPGAFGINTLIPIAAGGCLCLEPNGAHREAVYGQGLGAIMVIEYWFQARPDGTRPIPTVTVI